jgi:hypothetical protein
LNRVTVRRYTFHTSHVCWQNPGTGADRAGEACHGEKLSCKIRTLASATNWCTRTKSGSKQRHKNLHVTEKWCGVPRGRIFRRQSPRLGDLVPSRLSQDCGASEALITGIPDAVRRQIRYPHLPPHSAGRNSCARVHLCICTFVHLYVYAFVHLWICTFMHFLASASRFLRHHSRSQACTQPRPAHVAGDVAKSPILRGAVSTQPRFVPPMKMSLSRRALSGSLPCQIPRCVSQHAPRLLSCT